MAAACNCGAIAVQQGQVLTSSGAKHVGQVHDERGESRRPRRCSPRLSGGAVRRPPAWPSTQIRPHRARRRPHATTSSTSAVRRPRLDALARRPQAADAQHAVRLATAASRRLSVTATPSLLTRAGRRPSAAPKLGSRSRRAWPGGSMPLRCPCCPAGPRGNPQRRRTRRSGWRRARRESQATKVLPCLSCRAVRRPPAWPSKRARPQRVRRRSPRGLVLDERGEAAAGPSKTWRCST